MFECTAEHLKSLASYWYLLFLKRVIRRFKRSVKCFIIYIWFIKLCVWKFKVVGLNHWISNKILSHQLHFWLFNNHVAHNKLNTLNTQSSFTTAKIQSIRFTCVESQNVLFICSILQCSHINLNTKKVTN